MKLRHLRYFIAVAEELNFTRAAKKLNISQPPLSQQIIELENIIGVRLLYRDNRSVELTEEGKEFLKGAYKILEELENVIKATKKIQTKKKEQLNIGFSEIAIYDLITVISLYKNIYPNINISFHRLSAERQLDALSNKKIDIGLSFTPINNNFKTFPIRKQKFLVVMPKGHKLANEISPINISEFNKDTFFLPPKSASPDFYSIIMSIFLKEGLFPYKIMTTYTMSAIMALVSSGLGVSILPETINNYKIDNLIFKELSYSPYMETSLIWCPNSEPPMIEEIIKLLKYYLEQKII